MRCSRLICSVFLFLGSVPAWSESGEPVPSIILSCHVYRVFGGVSTEVLLNENIRVSGKDDVGADRMLTLFDRGSLRLEDERLDVGEDGWRWGEKGATRPAGDCVETVTAPKVMFRSGEKAEIRIESRQKMEFFERLEEDLFRHKTFEEPTGMTLSVRAKWIDGDRIHVENMGFTFRVVAERKPLPGVSLAVGPPILRTRKFQTELNVSPGTDYGILVHPGAGESLLILRFRLDGVDTKGNDK